LIVVNIWEKEGEKVQVGPKQKMTFSRCYAGRKRKGGSKRPKKRSTSPPTEKKTFLSEDQGKGGEGVKVCAEGGGGVKTYFPGRGGGKQAY